MVNYGIFISREKSRKGVVTPIVYLSGNSFRTFWNVSSSAQLDRFVIWFEYQNLEYLLYFHHQLTGPKRYTPTIIACFWEQDNGILMLEQLIDQTSQSHHCSIFWRHQSKGSVGTLHNISCSSIEVQCEKLSQWTPCIKCRFSNKDYRNRFTTRFQLTLQFDVSMFPYFIILISNS